MKENFISDIQAKECLVYNDEVVLPGNGLLEESEFENIEIAWNVEMQCKSYGIAGHIKKVTNVCGTIVTSYFDENSGDEDEPKQLVGELSFFLNEKFEECVKYKSTQCEVDLLMELDFSFDETGNLGPTELEIDFKCKTFTLK